jgi:rfaE bifunctional protein kinase chain/domain
MSYQQLLERFKGKKALVVGDLMLDEYILGSATRISPEAPVMVVRQTGIKNHPGGSGNVALNLLALGAEVSILGVLGRDQAGDTLQNLLEQSGMETSGIIRQPDRVTTRKTRVLADHSHQVLRVDHEDDDAISDKMADQLAELGTGRLKSVDVLVMSDYLKGAMTHSLCRELITKARSLNVPVVANPKPRSVGHFVGVDLLSLNRLEATEAQGHWNLISTSEAPDLARHLRESLQVKNLLITLGEAGMVASGAETFRVPAPRVEVYDTAGAGDTVIATVALGLATAGFQEDVFKLAAETAACVVRRVGVASPSRQDLDEICASKRVLYST